jgi:lysophospholipase L1-like esterase
MGKLFWRGEIEIGHLVIIIFRRRILAGSVGFILIFSTLTLCQIPESLGQVKPNDRPFNLLVLGDSVLWGEGLKTEHKIWYQVKSWLSENTGRAVIERIEAHSGAVIESRDTIGSITVGDGEVNLALPTVRSQVDAALHYYKDGSKVDLVLVNGCANDIDAQNLLNPTITTAEIHRMTEAKCGAPVERLLRKITSSFPNAHVIITGYYPFFSKKTREDVFMKALARRFFKNDPDSPRMRSRVTLERLTANSKGWYEASNKSIADAVAKVNTGLGSSGSNSRIVFVEIHFLPEHSFGAKETQLWGLDHSPFKRLLVFLSLGKIQIETNDELRKQRNASCDELYKRRMSETRDEKEDRKKQRLICRYAALGHPNQNGAQLYADAITSQLKSVVSEAGWIRELQTR